MKTAYLFIIASIFLIGCKENYYIDTTPPSPPQGLRVLALDNAAELSWVSNTEPDLAGYKIWVSDRYDGKYTYVATVSKNNFVDYEAKNGVRYYYAVTAFDYTDNESDLSADVIYATPRPEGYGTRIDDYRVLPNSAGYDFSTYSIGKYNDNFTDVFFENYNGRYYLDVWNDTDIQDMGYTATLDDIAYAPSAGWAPSKSAEAIVGHTYVIWTVDDHYAKMRVKEVTASRITFDWAYQLVAQDPQLKRGNPDGGIRNLSSKSSVALNK